MPCRCRTRRSSIATGSRSPRGTTWSTSRWLPARPRAPNVVKPKEVAANVSGDQRYGGDRGLHVDSMVVRGPVPLDDRASFPSRIGGSCSARPNTAINRGSIVPAR